MAAIYLKHPVHGNKVACSQAEADYDVENGWVVYDPAPPAVPAFLAKPAVVSDLPEDFPGREALIKGNLVTWESIVGKTRDELIAVKGIGPKLADEILKVMES